MVDSCSARRRLGGRPARSSRCSPPCKQAGFTEDSFKACLANQKVLDGIEGVRNRAAEKFKVDSTPTFFINGKMQVGAMSIEDMEKQIDPLLKS